MAGVDYSGTCRCGNVHIVFSTAVPLDQLHPRCCDCDFCKARNAAWVSDPNGSLRVSFANSTDVCRERQGAALVDFYSCKTCGDLLMVAGDINGVMRAAINSRRLDDHQRFGGSVAASPKYLSPQEKAQRWASAWIADVTIDGQVPHGETRCSDA